MVIRNPAAAFLAAALLAPAAPALAQNAVKIGLLAPMTGPFASTGKQFVPGARLYMQLNGDVVAGRKIELIVKDDAGNADITKRLVQETCRE
jgi:branched-chain amino acid transport system substrate-binding protein